MKPYRVRVVFHFIRPWTTLTEPHTAFTCTVKSSCGYSLIRTCNWTNVLMLVYKNQERISLLAKVCPTRLQLVVILSLSACCYWTFLQVTSSFLPSFLPQICAVQLSGHRQLREQRIKHRTPKASSVPTEVSTCKSTLIPNRFRLD